jgi:pimeloyl-ACP methyl ester carboxylesterase
MFANRRRRHGALSRAWSLALVPLAVLLMSDAAAATPRTLGALAFEPCRVPVPGGRVYDAHCTGFQVPENPAQPRGRQIELRLVLLPARTQRAADDVVVFLAGGPGQSAVESYPLVQAALDPLRQRRHVLLVEQRGTGSSRLDCPSPDWREESAFGPEAGRQQAQACLQRLQDRSDPVHYTTADYIRDLEAVRAAARIPQVNLIGGSYGTRVAQEYLRRHPDAVRSVVLDAVVPPQLPLLNDHARNLDQALQKTLAQCGKDPVCAERFGDPWLAVQTLRAQLREQPQEVPVLDPRAHDLRQETLSEEVLAGVLRLYAYAPQAASLLPLLVDEALHGRPQPLVAQSMLLFAMLEESLAYWMQLSVLCTEDAHLLQVRAGDQDTLLGTSMVENVLAQCEVWPRGKLAADFKQPVRSDKPVLILSGELDPVTPPRYGDDILAYLSNARHLVLPGQGHTVLARGCVPRLLRRFIDDTDPRGLDADCIDHLGYVPFFTSFQGPEP